jgi:hypothetical protein
MISLRNALQKCSIPDLTARQALNQAADIAYAAAMSPQAANTRHEGLCHTAGTKATLADRLEAIA